MDPGPHQWSDSEPEVDTVGIYVENHFNRNREFVIWIRFDNMKLGEKGSLPQLLEDPLNSETCPLEESASHHLPPGGEWFAPITTSNKLSTDLLLGKLVEQVPTQSRMIT